MFAPNVQLYTATHPTGKCHYILNKHLSIKLERNNNFCFLDPDLRCYPQLWELAKPIKVNNTTTYIYLCIFISNVTLRSETESGSAVVSSYCQVSRSATTRQLALAVS
jgi:hypothetical protein